ncbi:MAG TPA: acetoin utilization protein AcuC [Thioalkalivibrio sp.]|nr:acetoin utilization protein AcuC [Thioalkalivibrio sp.]
MNGSSTGAAAAPVAPNGKAVLIGSGRYRRHSYGRNHPLGIPRVSLTLDLIDTYGALSAEQFVESRPATSDELQVFHTPEYVAAMRDSEREGRVTHDRRQRLNIGNFENPLFPEFFTTPATATHGSILGAERVLQGHIAFNPAGGMHHARPDSARGFCFFNDPVLGILRLRREGLRVLYLDIDAHHGDGVEQAFRQDPEVLTLSLHMDTGYAYPFEGGRIEDTGPLNNAVNLPLPDAIHDVEYRFAFDRVWPATLSAFRPDALVVQAGTDILGPDPLGRFRVTTQLFLEIVERVMNEAPRHPDGTPRLLVLGGGGYHPLSLARCWTGVWGVLSGRSLPEAVPREGQALLRAVEWDLDDPDEEDADREWLYTSRVDPPVHGTIRENVRSRVDALLGSHPRLRGRG